MDEASARRQATAIVRDVLDRYRLIAAEKPGEENFFKFYQMDVTLTRA
jgi:trans-aconitate 2-methyltransferase